MIWKTEHEEILCREILIYEPFNHKSGSIPRGETWTLIAEALNSLDRPKFTVTQRSVREKYNALEKAHEQKNRNEVNATGIAPDEPTDLDKALDEIVAKFEEIELSTLKDKDENNKKAEKERETATEMRLQCMETFSDTRKRKFEETKESKKKEKDIWR